MNSSGVLDSTAGLPPNTPQDVVLPRYDNMIPSPKQTRGHLVTPALPLLGGEPDDISDFEPEVIDFTYVNISETDADEVDVTGVFGNQRGDVLAILLQGGPRQSQNTEALLVSTGLKTVVLFLKMMMMHRQPTSYHCKTTI